jgi:hypothetical protein
MLEERGLATVVIALVLPHVEKTRPPRALMTPFMLGRPLGEPNDAAFQTRILMQALNLLTRTDGPVLLEHFGEDNPSWFDRPGWQAAPVLPAALTATLTAALTPTLPAALTPALPSAPNSNDVHRLSDASAWEAAFRAELTLVLPAWERFKARFGRTTVGLAGQGVADWPSFATSFLTGALPTVAAHETPALSLRFLVDDIKALYGEAAQADGGAPSARQIDTWFWRNTVAARLLLALRAVAMDSPNNALKTVGGRFFVPVPYLPT